MQTGRGCDAVCESHTTSTCVWNRKNFHCSHQTGIDVKAGPQYALITEGLYNFRPSTVLIVLVILRNRNVPVVRNCVHSTSIKPFEITRAWWAVPVRHRREPFLADPLVLQELAHGPFLVVIFDPMPPALHPRVGAHDSLMLHFLAQLFEHGIGEELTDADISIFACDKRLHSPHERFIQRIRHVIPIFKGIVVHLPTCERSLSLAVDMQSWAPLKAEAKKSCS